MAAVRLERGNGQGADFRPCAGARARHEGDIVSDFWGRLNDSVAGTSHLSLNGPREREAVAGTLSAMHRGVPLRCTTRSPSRRRRQRRNWRRQQRRRGRRGRCGRRGRPKRRGRRRWRVRRGRRMRHKRREHRRRRGCRRWLNDSVDGTSHLSLNGPREREAVAGTLSAMHRGVPLRCTTRSPSRRRRQRRNWRRQQRRRGRRERRGRRGRPKRRGRRRRRVRCGRRMRHKWQVHRRRRGCQGRSGQRVRRRRHGRRRRRGQHGRRGQFIDVDRSIGGGGEADQRGGTPGGAGVDPGVVAGESGGRRGVGRRPGYRSAASEARR